LAPAHSKAPRPGPTINVAFLFQRIEVSQNRARRADTENPAQFRTYLLPVLRSILERERR